MPAINLGPAVRIYGTKETITALGNMRKAPKKALRDAAINRSQQALTNIRNEMNAEYRSPWATGEAARSLKMRVNYLQDGVSVQLTGLGGERDHLTYITALAPGGFDKFPVRPFEIKPVSAKMLIIRMPGHARKFIRNEETGKLMGASGSKIYAKKVMWGSRSGGFKRDVIAETAQLEGQSFVQDVQAAFAASLQSIVMHPKNARSFLQDPATGRMMGSQPKR